MVIRVQNFGGAGQGQPVELLAVMDEARACSACGVAITPHPRERRRRETCGQACYAWTRRHPGVPRQRVRNCQQCGADISNRHVTATYCSERCSNVFRGVVRDAPLPIQTCALPECGETFQPRRPTERCCSEKHGKLLYNRESRADGRQPPEPWTDARRDRYHRRRAQKKATSTGAPVLLAEIAERDGWRCNICRQRVGKKIAWPHSRSASLDHVVPLSKGGAHDPANVRLAHLGCNSSKGNKGGGEQLLLIG
ncbi:HNH endonuclease [Streptomyces scopuliridis]|uniref:HNH endonuclease n=1 Tax=Streptomyces scopuliridis TaxID=452529 RepID=UPI0035E37669